VDVGFLDEVASALGSIGDALSEAVGIGDDDAADGAANASARPGSARLLPAGAPPLLPYVATQLLADLGSTRTQLTSRTLKRLRTSFPVPSGQEVLWADAAFGTRSHGLVLTDVGIVIKDGPADDDDEDGDADDESPARAAGSGGSGGATSANGLEVDGLGYRYIRWESFDPARLRLKSGVPTLDGEPLMDVGRFRSLAAACTRINNRRVRARRSGKEFSRATGLLADDAPVRSVCRSTAAATFEFCFDIEGEYKFYADAPAGHRQACADRQGAEEFDEPLVPKALEVPLDQYDAILERMRRKISEGRVPLVRDQKAVGALVRAGSYTYAQAVNLAKTGLIPGVEYRSGTGSVVCRDSQGLGAALQSWLSGRALLGRGRLTGEQGRAEQVSAGVGEALAHGTSARANAEKDPRVVTGEQAARFVAGSAASSAGYALGATGARILMSAVGVASGPLAMIASFALGDACGKAGVEAFSMAKDLIFEPRERIMERLFDGVLSNVAFEYALTAAEQALLAEVMARVDPRVYQGLGASLADAQDQEGEIRKLVVPMVEAIRRA
jgi:hypothetical protein